MVFKAIGRDSRYLLLPLLLLTLALFATQDLGAQTLYGSMVGNVTDPTGAAIPGADVTASHQESGRVRAAITNEVGAYNFPTIRTGNWTIKVSMPGFKEYVNTNVLVTVNNVTRTDVVLQLGEVTETLTVTAQTSLLQTDRGEVRAEVAEKSLKDLPVPLGRNYQNLFDTLAGFTTPTNQHSIPTNPSRALSFSVNGVSESLNDIRIDGASQYDIWLPHITVYIPTLEAIQTVNVVTSSFEAEQGLAGGAAINVQIKSGTNAYHGSGFWYHSDNALYTRPYFNPPGFRKPKYINNSYGGTVGGPIKKEKLFFFLSFEGTPERSFAGSLGDVPTMAMRRGDLSGSDLSKRNDRIVYDPLTGDANGRNRTPFPGNIIPDNRIHPVAKKIFSLMPEPMFPGLSRNYFASGVFEFDRNVLDGKMDYQFNDKFNMYGRFSILRYRMLAPTFFGDTMIGRPLAGSNSKNGSGGTYGTTIAGTYIFTPNFVVDANFGWTRKDTTSEMVDLDKKIGLDVLGIPGTNGPRRFEGSWPRFRIDGFETVGIHTDFMPYYRRDPQTQVAGNANWTRGRHNVRFGAEVVSQHMNQTQPEFSGQQFEGAQGGFRFRGSVTTVRGGKSANDFNHVGAFLLGLPQQMGRILQVDDEYTTRMKAYSLYARDRWQVTPKLSLSLGVRWEYLPMPTRKDRGLERYDFVNNKMLVCGIGSVPKDCGVELSKRMFAPRVGLAYRATKTFVIRAGYGITNDPYSLARPHRTNPPMMLPLNMEGKNSFFPVGDLTTGLPLLTSDFGNGIVDVGPQIAVISVGPKVARGYVQSWNLNLQKEMFWGFVGEVGYVATRQVRQFGELDLNAGQELGKGQAGRPFFQKFGRTAATELATPLGHGHYDSLQAQLNRRFANGFQVNMNYVWSKNISNGLNRSDSSPRIRAFQYFHLNRSLANIDVPHRFNLATIFELPFGAGKPWLADGLAGAVLGGWQVNTTLYRYSGRPFSIDGGGGLDMPGSTQRADQIKPGKVQIFDKKGPGQDFFDTSAFASVADLIEAANCVDDPVTGKVCERFGNAGFNILRGPRQFNMDVGLFRKFRVTEDVELQVRAEAFNFTNTPHFNVPEGTITDSDFGEVTGIRNRGREGLDQRTIRFGLRLSF